MEKNNFFANPDKLGQIVRKIVALAVVCMLFFAAVSCENVTAYDEEYVEEYVEECKKECAEEYVEECVEECKKECVEECKFDLSELNEENCHPELGWAVELTLKSGITDCPIEDPKIKALEAEHNVIFRRSFQGTTIPELMRYYTLLVEEGCDMYRARAAVRAFLATGMFKHVRVFEIASTAN